MTSLVDFICYTTPTKNKKGVGDIITLISTVVKQDLEAKKKRKKKKAGIIKRSCGTCSK